MKAEVGAGDIVGEMALIDHHPRTATVRATHRRCTLLAFDAAKFRRLLDEMPKAQVRVMEQLVDRLRQRDLDTSTPAPTQSNRGQLMASSGRSAAPSSGVSGIGARRRSPRAGDEVAVAPATHRSSRRRRGARRARASSTLVERAVVPRRVDLDDEPGVGPGEVDDADEAIGPADRVLPLDGRQSA